LPMTYCLLITTPTVVNLGGNFWQGVLITILSIILGWAIERVRRPLNYHDSESIIIDNIIIRTPLVIVSFWTFLFSIMLANSLELTMGSRMEVNHLIIELGNFGIDPITVPTLNTPFVTLLLVPMCWQMNRVMMNTYSRGVEMKQQFYETIGPAKRGRPATVRRRINGESR